LRLPENAPFPDAQRGKLLLGLAPGGRPVAVAWNKHLMLGGMTGSGKSTSLRLIVYQALQEGFRLALCDVGTRTFPMLKNHPALLTALVSEPGQAAGFAEAVLAEMARREKLFELAPGYPDDLDEYNTAAAQAGQERLSRLLVVFDEYTDLVLATGGAKGRFSELAARIALGARKWGLTLVFAGHQFQRETSGLIREQCSTRLCFRVEDHTTASIVVGTAEPTGLTTPGRAILRGEGKVQTFYLDKSLLVDLAQTVGPCLTADERRLAEGLLARGGLVSVDNLTALGVGPRPAERLVQAWDTRGWSAKDPLRKNGRYLTPALLALLRGRPAETAEAVEPAETRLKRAETAGKLE
jgi:DNA segregation ATPase FtsK/SpoIIIE-like protein